MHISASEFILFCGDPAENVRKLSAIVPEVELMIDGDAWDLDANGTWDKQPWQPSPADKQTSPRVPWRTQGRTATRLDSP